MGDRIPRRRRDTFTADVPSRTNNTVAPSRAPNWVSSLRRHASSAVAPDLPARPSSIGPLSNVVVSPATAPRPATGRFPSPPGDGQASATATARLQSPSAIGLHRPESQQEADRSSQGPDSDELSEERLELNTQSIRDEIGEIKSELAIIKYDLYKELEDIENIKLKEKHVKLQNNKISYAAAIEPRSEALRTRMLELHGQLVRILEELDRPVLEQ